MSEPDPSQTAIAACAVISAAYRMLDGDGLANPVILVPDDTFAYLFSLGMELEGHNRLTCGGVTFMRRGQLT